MYFPTSICKFSRGEEVVKAGSGVRCTTRNGTCSYIPTLKQEITNLFYFILFKKEISTITVPAKL